MDGSHSADDPFRDILPVLRSKEETRRYYDKIARVYDILSERAEEPMRRKGLQLLAPQPGEVILEIGFGTGHSLAELARAVAPSGKVYGIDISGEMVRLAHNLLEHEGVLDRVELTQGDATELPYDDSSIDAVFTSFTLELFPTDEIGRVLSECRRVLKSGGRLSVVSLSKEGKQGMIIKAYEWTHRHFPNLLDCRPIHVRRAIEKAGFEVVEVMVDHMWVPVEIVLAKKPDAGCAREAGGGTR